MQPITIRDCLSPPKRIMDNADEQFMHEALAEA
jgi:hypothetical protein